MNDDPEREQCLEFWQRAQPLLLPGASLAGFFDELRAVGLGRAPGRLDVMGGIADYSGSLVLELPLAEAAYAAAQLQPEAEIEVVSVDLERTARVRRVKLPSAAFLRGDFACARQALPDDSSSDWAGYVLGTVTALARSPGAPKHGGVRLLLASQVPEGKGVSSSAAIEVAALFALAAAAGVTLEAKAAALACQEVENQVVGAPCGVMDQMTAACGERGKLLELLCQPATILGHCPVPADVAFFGIDSGLRHAVTGAGYGDVRVAAFMGYRVLKRARAALQAAEPASAPGWGGYLANVSVVELEAGLLSLLPERLGGAEFLAEYAGIDDSVTRVEPARTYAVRAATVHPIREHQRVRLFAELLRAPPSERRRLLLGELMFESHASYSRCGLGSRGTDEIVELVRAAGPESGLYGAKITGGGSGGTVAVLARAGAEASVQDIAARYAESSRRTVRIFAGSSAGAAQLAGLCAPRAR